MSSAASLTPDQLAATVDQALQCEGDLRSAGIEGPAELQPMHRFAIAAEQVMTCRLIEWRRARGL